MSRDAHEELPLKPHWFHILLALASDDLHGSGIVRRVEEETGGSIRLWPAMLYGSLDDMRAAGWIHELTDPDERPEGASRRRRIYRIAPRGRQVLEAEAERLAGLARLALERAGGTEAKA